VLEAGPEGVGASFYERALEQRESGGTPLDLAARLAVFLAAGESDGITGKLISAPWDPWGELPLHAEDLRESDVYTLRRTVPSEGRAGLADDSTRRARRRHPATNATPANPASPASARTIPTENCRGSYRKSTRDVPFGTIRPRNAPSVG